MSKLKRKISIVGNLVVNKRQAEMIKELNESFNIEPSYNIATPGELFQMDLNKNTKYPKDCSALVPFMTSLCNK